MTRAAVSVMQFLPLPKQSARNLAHRGALRQKAWVEQGQRGWEVRIRLGDAGIEGVAGGAHGTDQVLVSALVERLAQAANMDVDGAQFDLGVAAPDRIEQLLAREDAPGPLEQEAQETKFGW